LFEHTQQRQFGALAGCLVHLHARRLLEQAHARLSHVRAAHVTPLAVPSLLTIGRERVGDSADSALLLEAEALIAEAMRVD
jgi:ATP-dependent Lhr-like helicase